MLKKILQLCELHKGLKKISSDLFLSKIRELSKKFLKSSCLAGCKQKNTPPIVCVFNRKICVNGRNRSASWVEINKKELRYISLLNATSYPSYVIVSNEGKVLYRSDKVFNKVDLEDFLKTNGYFYGSTK